ncbi:MAG: YcaO-like family protein, partial [Bdellovibrionales bacterium]|nr:YcaO-like family protein [Bdellovibrionales bacterium]
YWRCFLSGIKLDLGSPQDAKLQRLLASIQIPTQQIQIYLLLGEFLIPVICAVFFGRGPNQPQVVISTASSFHLENAIFRALVELSQIVSNLPSDRLLGNLNTLNKSDDQLVDDFLQHGLYYLKKENFSFLSFLFENSESSNIPEMRKLFEQGPHQNFEQLVAAMKKKEYDLMFKSYLTPEIQRIGGYVVRALCPPLIPLDFRHKTRALGGKRYINFQDNLNIKSNIVESQNLNQKPHPLF